MRLRWACKPLLVLVGALVTLAPAGVVSAQSDEEAASTPPFCRVEDDGTIICDADVVVVLEVLDIVRVDERERLVEIDASLGAFWEDPRLDAACELEDPARVFQDEAARDKLKTIWWPDLWLVDGIGARETAAVGLTVFCGFAFYQERFVAEIRQEFDDLNDFPFDRHDLIFTVAPFSQGNDVITFDDFDDAFDETDDDSDDDRVGTSNFVWETNEWTLDKEDEFGSAVIINPFLEEASYQSDDDLPPNDEYYADPGDPGTFYGDPDGFLPSATFTVGIDRKPRFYLANIILPLILIVALSWSVFWSNLGGITLAERLGVSITCLLTVVAFDFLTGDSLPRLSYTTRLDVFYNFSYTFVAATVLVSIISAGQLKRAAEHASTGELPAPGTTANTTGELPAPANTTSELPAPGTTANTTSELPAPGTTAHTTGELGGAGTTAHTTSELPAPGTTANTTSELPAPGTTANTTSELGGAEIAGAAAPRRRRDRTEVTRLDEVSRVLFPVLYAIAVVISLLGWLSPGQG